jgi:hypothetical protein
MDNSAHTSIYATNMVSAYSPTYVKTPSPAPLYLYPGNNTGVVSSARGGSLASYVNRAMAATAPAPSSLAMYATRAAITVPATTNQHMAAIVPVSAAATPPVAAINVHNGADVFCQNTITNMTQIRSLMSQLPCN